MRLLFLDIETTGFSRKFDDIIELAGIVYDTKTKQEIGTFHEYIKPAKSIPIQITQLTGITNEMVESADAPRVVLKRFVEFINLHNPIKYVGHNIDSFDILWLREKCEFLAVDFPNKPTIDTLKIAREDRVRTSMFTTTGRPSYKQESIAQAYGIKYNAHSAIDDVRALIEIYKIIGRPESEEKTIDRKRSLLGF